MSKKVEYNFCKHGCGKLRKIPLWVFDENEALTHMIAIYQCPKCKHIEATIKRHPEYIKRGEEAVKQ